MQRCTGAWAYRVEQDLWHSKAVRPNLDLRAVWKLHCQAEYIE